MALLPCEEIQVAVEDRVEKPMRDWIKKTAQKCKKKKCKKWCLCCNKWWCWMETVLVAIVYVIVYFVVHIVTYLSCRFLDILLTGLGIVAKWLLCFANALKDLIVGRPSYQVDHIFVLMLENRSFDHMLGAARYEGRDAVTGEQTQIQGLSGDESNDVKAGSTVTSYKVRSPAQYVLVGDHERNDPGHEFDDAFQQLSGQPFPGAQWGGVYPQPTNNGFAQNYFDQSGDNPSPVMEYFSWQQLPVLHTLAEEFAVCDQWFSSLPGPTVPNRFFVHAASSGGLDDSPNKYRQGASQWFYGFHFANGTLFDKLDWGCIEWKVFEGDEFPLVFQIEGMNTEDILQRYRDFDEFKEAIDDPDFSTGYVFIEPDYGRWWLDFNCGTSMHPMDDVTSGERLIKEVYETIRNSPHWTRSLLLILWDEHGGFYDHIKPPNCVAPGDTRSQTSEHGFDFTRLGVRVPAIVVSPLIPKRTIDHTTYDHSSVPATVLRNFRQTHLTARDAAAKDVLHLMSLSKAREDAPVVLPQPSDSNYVCVDVSGGGSKLYPGGSSSTMTPPHADTGAGPGPSHGGQGPSGGGGQGHGQGQGQGHRHSHGHGQGGHAGSRAGAMMDDPAERPMSADAASFLHVAFLRHLRTLRSPEARKTLVDNFLRMRTESEAARYGTSVRAIVRQAEPAKLMRTERALSTRTGQAAEETRE